MLPPTRSLLRPADVLPHGEAFRFVETVVSLSERSIVATRRVPQSEPWTMAHFPHSQIVPGVLLIEGMAQTCGILARSAHGEPGGLSGSGMLTAVRNARFHHPVSPGCLLTYQAELLMRAGALHCFQATTTVDGQLIAQAELVLSLGPATSTAPVPLPGGST